MSEKTPDDILLFFTSNARPLYRRDLLNVCTEPENSRIRFGYDKDWIAGNTRAKIVIGAKVLIVYCELKRKYSLETPSLKISGNLEFCPTRKAKVVAVEFVNESLLVDLELKEFFRPAEKGDKADKQRAFFQTYVTSLAGNPDTHDRKKRRYILSGTLPTKTDSLEFTTDCLPLINYAKRLNGLKDCYFICGLEHEVIKKNGDLKALETPPVILTTTDSVRPKYCFPQHEYKNEKNWHTLKAGKDYRVRLLVIPGKDAPPDQVPRLSIEETIPTVNVLGPFVKQNPFGFRTDFIVRCKNSLAEEWGAFFVRAKVENEEEVHKSSEIFGLIKVKKDNWYLGIFFLIPLSIFFTFTGPDFIREFVDYPWNKYICSFICLSPISVSMIFKFIGVLLSLMASYILTSKISFK